MYIIIKIALEIEPDDVYSLRIVFFVFNYLSLNSKLTRL